MPKQKKSGAITARSKSSKVPYSLILGVAAIVAAAAIYFFSGRGAAPAGETGEIPPEYTSTNPALRNRLILPARAHPTRPITLPPESFTNDEVRRSYQAAKDHPEALESVACYCGCYGDAGHRNNLDCFRDNHGIT
jgi:hypothetical protein